MSGRCDYCGRDTSAAHDTSVRRLVPNGPRACYDCRPAGTVAGPLRRFALLLDFDAYMIEAETRERAEAVLKDEMSQWGAPLPVEVRWDAGDQPEWVTAWRRKAVTIIQDRPLPDGLE